MSSLVDLPADASIVPVTRASRPSFASPTAPAIRVRGAGTVPVPIDAIPPLAGRSSVWPYGSARTPRTSRMAPRAGGATPSGSLTGSPPVASPIASRAGVPSRPASAMTTPRTTTGRPTGACRASATVIGASDSVGTGVAVGARCRDRRRRRRHARRGRGGRRRGRGRGRRGRRGRRGQQLELARERRVQPIAGESRPRAVALAERTASDDDRASCRRGIAKRGHADDDPDLARAVVDRQPEAVAQRAGRLGHGPADLEPEALERLGRGAVWTSSGVGSH